MSDRLPSGFETFAVTADTGIRAWGPTLAAVFREAARGLFSLMVEEGSVVCRERVRLAVSAGDRETLLAAWLNELLYLHETRAFVVGEWRIDRIEETALEAEVGGEGVDPARHVVLGHVKAATYHELVVRPTDAGWEARVIVDV